MSGLEVAGVVLGALPLVIAALEHYAQGINTAKRFWRYKTELRSVILQVKTEHRIYLNTLEQLLTGIVRTEHMAGLVNNPGSDAWRDTQLNDDLKERLSEAHDVYFDNVQAMRSALARMMKKLALDDDGKPQFTDPKSFKHEYKRLKFRLNQSEYAEQIEHLRNRNQNLTRLTKQSLDLESTRTGGKTMKYPNFKALQNYARDFYHTLRSGIHCSSGCANHAVNLRLENRNKTVRQEDLPELTYRVVFTHASNEKWKEAEIRCIVDEPKRVPLTSHVPSASMLSAPRKRVQFGQLDPATQQSPSPGSSTITISQRYRSLSTFPSLSQIHDLCQTVQQSCYSTTNPCAGYLLDSLDRKQGIYPLQCLRDAVQQPWSSYSLGQVLTEQAVVSIPLTQTDKLRIAVYLASSMLQLYKTPWLDETWNLKDVHFIQRPGNSPADISKQPFVYRKLEPTVTGRVSPTQPSYSIIRNQTLFALGILLIELWYGKPMERLVKNADRDCQGTPGVAWCTAERLLRADLPFEAGKQYADVVRRCIRCDFDRTDLDLDNESFQRAVYDGVVAPLEMNLKQFSGQDLG